MTQLIDPKLKEALIACRSILGRLHHQGLIIDNETNRQDVADALRKIQPYSDFAEQASAPKPTPVRTRVLNEQGAWVEADNPKERAPKLRRFVLDRAENSTGVSGVGKVAEGVCFADGRVVLRWLSELASTNVYDCMEDVIAVHGHDGATTVRWYD
jgi:hypothetical protein